MEERKIHSSRIALYGKSGVGKTTVANNLRDEYGFLICNTGHMCRTVSQLIFGDDDKSHLHIVTDALRTIDPAIFLKTAIRDIKKDAPVVIDAMRFSADLEYARQNNFYILRIDATDENRRKWLSERGQEFDWTLNGRHPAETELDNAVADGTVVNDSSVDSLIKRCLQVLATSSV